jgi:uncharacterized RDD family membrane protein YckC
MTSVGPDTSASASAMTRSLVTPEGVDLRLTLASAGERAAAFLLDATIILATLIALTLLIAWAFGVAGASAAGTLAMLWLVGAFVLRNGYFLLFELTARAATPGKRALGLRVVARDGGRLTSEAVFARNAMREIEIFLPLMFLAASGMAGEQVDALMGLLALVWSGIFLFFPLFNRDRLRGGDFVAGAWVVRAPRRALAADLAGETFAHYHRFDFTAEQLAAYGVKELQVLEQVLRARDKPTLKDVARRIRGKIGWVPAPYESDADFLSAYYGALRARLEHRLLFGHRRRDKFDTA